MAEATQNMSVMRVILAAYSLVFAAMIAVAIWTSDWFFVLTVGLPGWVAVGASYVATKPSPNRDPGENQP